MEGNTSSRNSSKKTEDSTDSRKREERKGNTVLEFSQ